MGTFLLSSVRYRINPLLIGESHVDWRTERGMGLGQDLTWRTEGRGYLGDVATYFLDDQKPVDDDEDTEAIDAESQRYRIRLRNTHHIGPRDYVLANLHYLSDEDILEDFFEDEYRRRRQPDNYVMYTHRGDNYAASMLMRGRMNDFYTSVNRLPEVSLSTMRQQAGDSEFYYEGETTASSLEKQWKDGSDKEDYSALRIDTLHTFSHPSKYLGFLTVTPRAG